MNIKDKIEHVKLAKVKVAVYDDNMVLLGDEGQFPEPLTPNYIDIGDLLDEMLKDIGCLEQFTTYGRCKILSKYGL